MNYELRALTVPISINYDWPATITPPHDRRHKWVMTSQGKARRWFRCTACGKRKSVTSLVSVLGAKIIDAQNSMADYLSSELFAS